VVITTNSDLTHAYLGSNAIAILEQLLNIGLLIRKRVERIRLQWILHITVMKVFYAQEIMMSIISVKMF
jgi:hypothetical protein